MNEWTDEALGTLLTETMRERAARADPVRAEAIACPAPPAPRRRWPQILVAAAMVAAAVVGTAQLVRDTGGETTARPTPPPPPASPPTPSVLAETDAAFRAAAASESERVLGLAPVPPGSVRVRGGSGALPPNATVGLPGQAHLSRTATYSVRLGPEAVHTFLLAHRPAGMRVDDDNSGSDGVRHLVLGVQQARAPQAYTNAFLLAEWRAASGTTTLRFSTFVAARPVRTDATRVLSARSVVVAHHDGPTKTVTDPATVNELIDATNALVGWADLPPQRCPFSGVAPPRTTLVFRGAEGTVRFAWTSVCGNGVHVRRDGRAVGPALDPGLLDATVDRLLF